MDVFSSGLATVILAIVSIAVSWIMFRHGNPKTALLMILLCGLVLRVFVSSDRYLHEWDEKYHAVVAKHLILHPLKPTLYDDPVLPYDHSNWISNHVWLEKPPVPLWFMAFSLRVLGTDEWAVRFPSILLSLLAVCVTYLLGRILFNEKTGLLAAFLQAINGLIIEVAGGRVSSDHVETCFIFFVELAVLCGVFSIVNPRSNRYAFLMGVFTGIAMLCKWFPALVVFPVWMTGAMASGKMTVRRMLTHFLLALAGCTLVAAPWMIYILTEFPAEADWVLRKFLFAFTGSVEGHTAPWWYYLNYIGIIYGEIVYLPLLFAGYWMVKNRRQWELMLLSAWWLLPVLVFSAGETKRHTYLLLSSPAVFIITSWFWFYLFSCTFKKRLAWLKYMLLFLLVALPVRYSLERVSPFDNPDRDPAWARGLRRLDSLITDDKAVIFRSAHPIETMFYTDLTAYSGSPDSIQTRQLLMKGYILYIYEGDSVKKMDTLYDNSLFKIPG